MSALAVALLLNGCSPQSQDDTAPADTDTSASADGVAPSGGAESGPTLLPVAVTYAYEPDTELTYRMGIDHTVDIEIDAPSGMTDLIGLTSGQIEINGETELTYQIGPGPDDETFQIHLTADLTGLAVSGELDAQALPGLDLLGIGEIPSVDLTVVVDKRGTILEYKFPESPETEALWDLLGGLDLSALSNMAELVGNINRPIGPVFPAGRSLDVGDTWTDQTTDQFGDQTIVTDHIHEVTGTAVLDGVEVIVIDSTATVEAFEIDLLEMMAAMLGGPVGLETDEEPDGTAPEEGDLAPVFVDLFGGLQMSVAWESITTETTIWMSYDRITDGLVGGIIRQATVRTSGTVTSEMVLPDETGYNPDVTITMDAVFAQDIQFSLTDPD